MAAPPKYPRPASSEDDFHSTLHHLPRSASSSPPPPPPSNSACHSSTPASVPSSSSTASVTNPAPSLSLPPINNSTNHDDHNHSISSTNILINNNDANDNANPSNPTSSVAVLSDLLRERAAIQQFRHAVPHLWTMLEAAIANHPNQQNPPSHSAPTRLARTQSTPLPSPRPSSISTPPTCVNNLANNIDNISHHDTINIISSSAVTTDSASSTSSLTCMAMANTTALSNHNININNMKNTSNNDNTSNNNTNSNNSNTNSSNSNNNSNSNNSNATKKRVKIPVPADRFPDFNFVGRLLGPRGTTLKTLARDTGCKIMIRGKGSIRKDKEADVRHKPGYEHVFTEPLHVVIEASDMPDDASAHQALQRAKEAVELLLVPVPEERDNLKRQQLRALAIMNGTYRGGPARSFDAGLLSSIESSNSTSTNTNSKIGVGSGSDRSNSSQASNPATNGSSSINHNSSSNSINNPSLSTSCLLLPSDLPNAAATCTTNNHHHHHHHNHSNRHTQQQGSHHHSHHLNVQHSVNNVSNNLNLNQFSNNVQTSMAMQSRGHGHLNGVLNVMPNTQLDQQGIHPQSQNGPQLNHTLSSHLVELDVMKNGMGPGLRRHHSQPIHHSRVQNNNNHNGGNKVNMNNMSMAISNGSIVSMKRTHQGASPKSAEVINLKAVSGGLHGMSIDDLTSSVDDTPESSPSSEDGSGNGESSNENGKNGLNHNSRRNNGSYDLHGGMRIGAPGEELHLHSDANGGMGLRSWSAMNLAGSGNGHCNNEGPGASSSSLGMGMFMGSEFYNGAFSNDGARGWENQRWDGQAVASSAALSSGAFELSSPISRLPKHPATSTGSLSGNWN